MNHQALQHLLSVVENGSFSRAAKVLGLTQSAVSKNIRKLEDQFGEQLLERGTGGARPTVFGMALVEHARMIELELRHAQQSIDDLRGIRTGTVTVGGATSIITTLVGPAAVQLIKRFPNIRVTAIEGLADTLIPELKRGRIDFIVGPGKIGNDHPDLDAFPIFADDIVISARIDHPLRSRDAPRLEDTLDYGWVMPFSKEFFSHQTAQLFRNSGLPPPVPVITTNSATCIRRVIADSDLLAFLPLQMITPEQTAGQVAPLEVEGGRWKRQAYLLRRRRGSLSPAAKALIYEIYAVCEQDREKLALNTVYPADPVAIEGRRDRSPLSDKSR